MESAFRDALRGELASPVASLVATLNRLADNLSGQGGALPTPAVSRRQQRAVAEETVPLLLEMLPGLAETPATPAPPVAAPRACAVIGCQNPVRSLGYCGPHYQKRRLMVASNRLHPAWVEGAEPHSIPDVILARRRRSESEEEEAPEKTAEAPAPAPRMWVRKKGQLPLPIGATEGNGSGPAATSAAASTPPAENDPKQVTATVERWVADFLANR